MNGRSFDAKEEGVVGFTINAKTGAILNKWSPSSKVRSMNFSNSMSFHNFIFLLTICEVHTTKYSDRSFDVRTE